MFELTGLDGTGSAVIGSSYGLLGLVESRLLGVGSDLLLGLVAEILASADVLVVGSLLRRGSMHTQSQTC